LSLIYGRRRIAASEFSAVKSLLVAARDGYDEADRLAGNLMAHVYRRERAAISSAAVFARTTNARSDVDRTVSMLNSDEAAARKRVDEAAALRAVELGVARATRPSTEAERRAQRLIPVPIKGKELFNLSYVTRTLAKDPAAEIPKITAALEEATQRLRARGESELRLFGVPDAPAIIGQNNQDKQDSEGSGGNNEKADGNQVFDMIVQEGAPYLGRTGAGRPAPLPLPELSPAGPLSRTRHLLSVRNRGYFRILPRPSTPS